MLTARCASLIRESSGEWDDGIERSDYDIVRLYREGGGVGVEGCGCKDCVRDGPNCSNPSDCSLRTFVKSISTLERNLAIKEYHMKSCKNKLESGVKESLRGRKIIEEIEVIGGEGREGGGVMGERV